jgi:hypothetical protein
MGWYVKAKSQAHDPQQRVLDDLQRHQEIEPWDDAQACQEPGVLLGLVHALLRSLNATMLYGRSLSSLVAEVRNTGDHKPLFDAVRVDPTVLTCPSVVHHMAVATLRQDPC